MKKLIFITLLPLMLFWHGIALANDVEFKRGEDAFKAGNYKEAIEIFKSLAEQGNVKAQYQIAKMYKEGEGVLENDGKAVKWYRILAEKGHAFAQLQLGRMYTNGEGVPENDIYAYMWIILAIENGLNPYVELQAKEEKELMTIWLSHAELKTAQDLAEKCLALNYENCD